MNEKKELSRAELVRLRREQEHARRMHHIAKEAARPMPVTVRAQKTTTASKVKTSKPKQNARRRFQLVLPVAPRAGMRSISIPRPRVGWRLSSFILSAIFGTALYFAFNLPQLRVTEAQVTGNQIVTPADVNSVLNISGQPIFMLTPADLETRLRLNYPELASVRVNVSLPNRVMVDVRERKPAIRWEQGGGYTWIAEDGVAFKPRGEMVGLISVVAESAPPVAGSGADPLKPAPFISTDMVQALKGLAGHVPPGQSILYDARMGFGWNDPRGWRAYFGATPNDIELKMRVYESMVDSLTQRGIRPALINVTYPTAPYYRMTQ
jgi:POTRA domain-containing FtsQ-type protein